MHRKRKKRGRRGQVLGAGARNAGPRRSLAASAVGEGKGKKRERKRAGVKPPTQVLVRRFERASGKKGKKRGSDNP